MSVAVPFWTPRVIFQILQYPIWIRRVVPIVMKPTYLTSCLFRIFAFATTSPVASYTKIIIYILNIYIYISFYRKRMHRWTLIPRNHKLQAKQTILYFWNKIASCGDPASLITVK